MSTLGRVLLAAGRSEEAIGWFDAALQRNDQFGGSRTPSQGGGVHEL